MNDKIRTRNNTTVTVIPTGNFNRELEGGELNYRKKDIDRLFDLDNPFLERRGVK